MEQLSCEQRIDKELKDRIKDFEKITQSEDPRLVRRSRTQY